MRANYSIDLETLGTRYDSYILSIGVAAFNIGTGEIINTFHRKTICGDNFNIDVGTVMWWLNQSDKARGAITKRETVTGKVISSEVPIEMALNDLSEFIVNHKNSIVWGNGSSFDITLLDHAYHECNLKQPWKFYNVRDMRTIVDIAKSIGFMKERVKFKGVKHDALADAEHQALVISNSYNYIRNGVYL